MQNKVGKYTLIEQIGSGTAGIVYRAEDPDIGRSVAIKIMKAEYFGSGAARLQAVERFSSEIRAIGRLAHPNIVSIFDSGINNDGLPFLVMQFVEGRGLDLILRDLGGALSPNRTINILKQLGSAIDYAHSQDVVHRDIKPSNILLARDDHVFIVDFSTAIVGDETLLQNGQVVGTPQFMAPEIIRGEPASASADLYSLGILAFLLFTGSKPFREGNITATFDAVLRQSAFSFAELGCQLGTKLERVLRRALAKDPEDRYTTAREFIAACEKSLGNLSLDTFSQVASETETDSGSITGSFRPQAKQYARRNSLQNFSVLRVIFLLLFFMAVVGLSILVFILYGTEQSSSLTQGMRTQLEIILAPSAPDFKKMSNESLMQAIVSGISLGRTQAAILEAKQRNTEELANTVSTLLSDSSAEVRTEAIKAIAAMTSLPNETYNHCLMLSLQDPDPFIRSFAAIELVRTKGKSARTAIKKQRAIEQDIMVYRTLDLLLSKI